MGQLPNRWEFGMMPAKSRQEVVIRKGRHGGTEAGCQIWGAQKRHAQ
jgi:hypothetical protein